MASSRVGPWAFVEGILGVEADLDGVAPDRRGQFMSRIDLRDTPDQHGGYAWPAHWLMQSSNSASIAPMTAMIQATHAVPSVPAQAMEQATAMAVIK